jgi:hypothetical protein
MQAETMERQPGDMEKKTCCLLVIGLLLRLATDCNLFNVGCRYAYVFLFTDLF